LARLQLSEAELDRLTEQLGQIVGYVDQLAELDTSGVEPMAHALDISNMLVEDALQPSLPRELALSNAPKQDGKCYLVPAVLGE
jgi:aspartyl-tRNA(Asn)/glutamyl-tRNA(Gln) amidotransferase subunit C